MKMRQLTQDPGQGIDSAYWDKPIQISVMPSCVRKGSLNSAPFVPWMEERNSTHTYLGKDQSTMKT